MIRNQKVEEFLEDLASGKPTPGGGAVAALVAAESAALVEMVVALTRDGHINHIGEKAHELRGKLMGLADEDVAAFDSVMAAYKSKDKDLIKKALNGAIVVPEQTKEYACLLQELAETCEKEGNKNALSDARAAVYLAQAAQKSAEENIEINKKSLANLGD